MEDIKLIKEYKSNHGRVYPAGSKIACCRDTYKMLLEKGYCEAMKGDKKVSKKKTKIEKKDGDNN